MHFGFIVDPEQFDAALRTIEEKSVKKVSEPSERGIGRYIFIEDPDGYTIEIFECLSPPYAKGIWMRGIGPCLAEKCRKPMGGYLYG